MARHRFHVEHLEYEHSVVGLGIQLQRLPSIRRVMIDSGASSATVDYDACCCGPREVARMIEECGYRCGDGRPADDDPPSH